MHNLLLSIAIIFSPLHAVIVQNNSSYTLFAIEDNKYQVAMMDNRYHILPNQEMHISEDLNINICATLFNNDGDFFVVRKFFADYQNNNAIPTCENGIIVTNALILKKYLENNIIKRSQ